MLGNACMEGCQGPAGIVSAHLGIELQGLHGVHLIPCFLQQRSSSEQLRLAMHLDLRLHAAIKVLPGM